MKECKTIYHVNGSKKIKNKKAGVAIVKTDKIDFKAKTTEEKKNT